MPCSVSREEALAYEVMHNKELYGRAEANSHITTAVACELEKELFRLVKESGLTCTLSKMALKWIEIHKEEDANR